MKPPIHDAAARQHSGGPLPIRGQGGKNARKSGVRDVEAEIPDLCDRTTQELRLAWRKWHRTEPPLGLSRDLLIRALAHDLQERAHSGPSSRALRCRLRTLARASEKGALSDDSGGLLKTGTTLVRQWRGHTHTVLVHNDGFEHEGQRYRSLTVIAKRITGAHWSGPRFFGLTRRGRTSLPAETNQ